MPLSTARSARTPEDRGHVRVRRRWLERPAQVARRLAEPQAADGRGRELPQRDPRVVPRGDRVRPRHDRHRHVPRRARHHRPQHPRRHRVRAQGLRRTRPRRPGRHPAADAGRPLARRDAGRGVGRRDRLSGLAPGHAGVRRAGPRRRLQAGRRVLGRGRRRGLGAAEPRAVPAAGRDARPCLVRRRVPGVLGRTAGLGRAVHAAGPPGTVLQPARRGLPGRPDRGHARLRADRRGRHVAALHHLQVARLHRPRLRHGLGVGAAAARSGRRRARAASRRCSRSATPASTS